METYFPIMMSSKVRTSLTDVHIVDGSHPCSDGQISERQSAKAHFRRSSSIVLESMELLNEQFMTSEAETEPAVLLSLIAYTNPDDPWNSDVTQRCANQILGRHQEQLLAPAFIIDHVLRGYIKPLFSSSKPPTVTPQGRKVISTASVSTYAQNDLDRSRKPWKFQHVSAVTVLGWAIKEMNVGNCPWIRRLLFTFFRTQ